MSGDVRDDVFEFWYGLSTAMITGVNLIFRQLYTRSAKVEYIKASFLCSHVLGVLVVLPLENHCIHAASRGVPARVFMPSACSLNTLLC